MRSVRAPPDSQSGRKSIALSSQLPMPLPPTVLIWTSGFAPELFRWASLLPVATDKRGAIGCVPANSVPTEREAAAQGYVVTRPVHCHNFISSRSELSAHFQPARRRYRVIEQFESSQNQAWACMLYSSAYVPSRAMSSLCEPHSIILPSCIT